MRALFRRLKSDEPPRANLTSLSMYGLSDEKWGEER
jgi:hypothetical protein